MLVGSSGLFEHGIPAHFLILSGQKIQTCLLTEIYVSPLRTRLLLILDLSMTNHQGQSRETWGGNCQLDWKTLLAYISGSVNEELLLRNEYLVAENRILRNQIKGRVQLSDAERQTLAEIGKKLDKQALEEGAHVVKPDTILGWHRTHATTRHKRLHRLPIEDGAQQRVRGITQHVIEAWGLGHGYDIAQKGVELYHSTSDKTAQIVQIVLVKVARLLNRDLTPLS